MASLAAAVMAVWQQWEALWRDRAEKGKAGPTPRQLMLVVHRVPHLVSRRQRSTATELEIGNDDSWTTGNVVAVALPVWRHGPAVLCGFPPGWLTPPRPA